MMNRFIGTAAFIVRLWLEHLEAAMVHGRAVQEEPCARETRVRATDDDHLRPLLLP